MTPVEFSRSILGKRWEIGGGCCGLSGHPAPILHGYFSKNDVRMASIIQHPISSLFLSDTLFDETTVEFAAWIKSIFSSPYRAVAGSAPMLPAQGPPEKRSCFFKNKLPNHMLTQETHMYQCVSIYKRVYRPMLYLHLIPPENMNPPLTAPGNTPWGRWQGRSPL